MKKIGITGPRGFLGQHLMSYFFDHSRTVKDILPFTGDVRKQKQVESFVKKCDLVIHLAAKTKLHPAQEIIETNINGTLNVINACLSHRKGFLTCVERNLTEDVFSISKRLQKSFVSEYNKLGFQGFVMKLDCVVGSSQYNFKSKGPICNNADQLLELLTPEDVCKWIYSFSDAFLTNGSFYVKEFEFWDPIRITVKDLKSLLRGDILKDVKLEHAQKILACLEEKVINV